MYSTTATLQQVFPHVPEATIAEIVGELQPNFVNQPERLLDRATSELLRGNYVNKKPKLVEAKDAPDVEIAEVVPVENGPGRDLVAEKVETTQSIIDMYPNVDPEWLSKHYDTMVFNGDRALRSKSHIEGLLANYMIEHSDYPKKTANGQKSKEGNDIDYSKYDQPITSADYRTNCLEQIQQDFRWVTLPELRSVLQRYGYHYFPSYNFLKSDFAVTKDGRPSSKSGLKFLSKERTLRPVDLYDPAFIVEYEVTHREEVKLREEEERKRLQALEDEEAERTGNVMECGCCFVDVPMTRMVQCAEGHLFCADCIKKYVEETVYSSGQTTVHCLDQDGCKANFPMAQLERAVPAHQLSKIFARLADLDIQKAGLENVHRCPSCDFQMEIPNPDEKLFICRNPECGLESCLLCKEPNHIPLRCEEVEKKTVTDYRKKVEEAMTASLVRTCPKCKAKFFKTEGCNKMTCSCGTHICYVCRAVIPHKEGYGHFCSHDRNPREFGKCAQCKKCFLFLRSTEEADNALVAAAKQDATAEFAEGDEALAQVQVGAVEPPKKTNNGKAKHHQHQHLHHYNPQQYGLGHFHQVQMQLNNIAGIVQQRAAQFRQMIGMAPAPQVPGFGVDWRGQMIAPPPPVAAAAPMPPPPAHLQAPQPAGKKAGAKLAGAKKAAPAKPAAAKKATARPLDEEIVISDDDLPPRDGVKRRAYEIVLGRNNPRLRSTTRVQLRDEDYDEDEDDDDFEAEEDYEDEDDFDDIEEHM